MIFFPDTLLQEFQQQLQFLHLENEEPIKHSKEAIKIILPIFEKLKAWCIKYKFTTQEEEIAFFRSTKPQLTSRLVFYNMIGNIEINKPAGTRSLRKYYIVQWGKSQKFLDNNLEFYRYYRSGSTYLDHKYFLRGNSNGELAIDNFYFQTDQRFCTTHDHLLSLIMAHEQILEFLETTIAKLKNKHSHPDTNSRSLKWTGSKVAMVEVIYALHTEGVFNHGTADLKELFNFFSSAFDIDLAQFHRTFSEICSRKSDRTKFLRSLNDALERRMQEADK